MPLRSAMLPESEPSGTTPVKLLAGTEVNDAAGTEPNKLAAGSAPKTSDGTVPIRLSAGTNVSERGGTAPNKLFAGTADNVAGGTCPNRYSAGIEVNEALGTGPSRFDALRVVSPRPLPAKLPSKWPRKIGVLNRTERVLANALAVIKSGLPSPFTSPAATWIAPWPGAPAGANVKPPLPSLINTESRLAELTLIKSILPSRFTSAAVTEYE